MTEVEIKAYLFFVTVVLVSIVLGILIGCRVFPRAKKTGRKERLNENKNINSEVGIGRQEAV
jgi:hypothetical protein